MRARISRPSRFTRPAPSHPKTAEIYNGLIRNIEATSRADVACDTALDFAVTMGSAIFASTRNMPMTTVRSRSEDQGASSIRSRSMPILIPPSPDSSDWNSCFVTGLIEKDRGSVRNTKMPRKWIATRKVIRSSKIPGATTTASWSRNISPVSLRSKPSCCCRTSRWRRKTSISPTRTHMTPPASA
jgi:hypothetical protein